jgi:hypothetical protein
MADAADGRNVEAAAEGAEPEAPAATTRPPETPAPDTAAALTPTRRPLRRRTWLVACAALFATVVIGGVTAMAVLGSVTGEYGFRPNADAAVWATRPLAFAPRIDCFRCHSDVRAVATTGGHVNLSCQGCHGPSAAHDAATDPRTVQLAIPSSDRCTRCHVATQGKPAFVPLIVPARHYTDACLDCHDPHSGVAIKPPVVPHPLTALPPCITCHGPDGFRARSPRHPTEPTEDAACLACHDRGRGAIESTGR